MPAELTRCSVPYAFHPPDRVERCSTAVTNAASGSKPAWLEVVDWNGQRLVYSTEECEGARAFVHTLSADGTSIQKLPGDNGVSTGGDGAVDQSLVNGQLFVANYNSGSAAVLSVGPDGRLGAEPYVIPFHRDGTGPVADRQDKSYAHQVLPSPDGRFVYVPDLGADRVQVLGVASRPQDTRVVASIPVPEGSGPRRLTFFQDGARTFAYLAMELSCQVQAYELEPASGALYAIGEPVNAFPPEAATKETRTLAEVVVTNDGRFVYASHRLDPAGDHIAGFARDPSTGTIKLQGWFPTHGCTPRHFSLSRDKENRYMAVANQDSDNVVLFRREPTQGTLEHVVTVSGTGPANYAGLLA